MNDLTPARQFEADPKALAPRAVGAFEAEGRPRGLVPRLSRRMLIVCGAIVLMAGASTYGWHYWTVARFEESTDDAYVKADSTIIAPKVAGYLRGVFVTDNQRVKAGDVLAKIDDRDFVVAVEQARADIAAAQAEVDNIGATIERQGAVIAQAKATVEVDRANLTFAEQDNNRYTTLARQGAGSIQRAQQATSTSNSARATLDRDMAALKAEEKQTSILQAQLARAKANLEHSRSVLHQAELNLSYTTIRAPVDGVVGDRSLRVGQFVQAGTQLMALVPLNEIYVVANYKETQLTYVRKGQAAELQIDTFPGVTIKGHVDSIAPASGQEFALLPPDNATGNFTKVVQRIPVKITLDVGGPLVGLLRPGMSVVPTIDTKAVALQPLASDEPHRGTGVAMVPPAEPFR